jgi:ketosteroid isomerase-like protein
MRIPAAHPLVVAACVLLAGVSSGNLRAHDPDAEALLKLNRQIMEDTILRQDPSSLLSHAHPDYRVVAPGGRVETREQTAAGVKSIVATGLEITQEQVHIAGDTGVVIGRMDIDGVMKPVGDLGPGKFMAVFVRQDGEWKILSRALTPCIQMAIEHGFC